MILGTHLAGIEIGPHEIKVAEVKNSLRGSRVTKLARVHVADEPDTPREQTVGRALKEVMKHERIRADSFISCLPSDKASVRVVTVPFKGERKVRSALRFELEPHVPFPVEELVVDFSVIEERGGATEVLAVGFRKEILDSHLASLREAGVVPQVVDVEFAPLTNLCLASREFSSTATPAAVHVTDSGIVLTILQNKKIVFVRNLGCSPDQLVSSTKDVCDEIRKTLWVFNNSSERGQVDKVYFTGLALPAELLSVIADNLGLEVKYLDLSNGLADGESGFWPVAVGLASRGVVRRQVGFNFLERGVIARWGRKRFVRHVVFSAVLLLLVVGSVAGNLGVKLGNLTAQSAALDAEIAKEFKAAFPEAGPPIPGQVGTQMKQLLDKETKEYSVLQAYTGEEAATFEILREIIAASPTTENFSLKNVEIRKDKITVTGVAASADVVNEVVAELTKNGDLTVDSRPNMSSTLSGSVEFAIVAKRGGGEQ